MTEEKETITFTQKVRVRDHNGKVTFKAEAGEVVELSLSSASRWMRRNKAVLGKVKLDKAPDIEPDVKEGEKFERQAPITSTQPKDNKVKNGAKKKATPKK